METTPKVVTVKDILIDVKGMLGDINVLASRIDDIGIPIARSINGIQACLDAIDREETKEEQTQEEGGEHADA